MTAEQLAKYHETREERLALERQAKTLKDTEDELGDQILAALEEADQTSAKRGAFRALLETVAGRVSWKDAFQSLKLSAEAAGVAVSDPTAEPSTRLKVVPA